MDIFRGLKFSPNAEIGENSHSRMDTNYSGIQEPAGAAGWVAGYIGA
jgi:hypothetical protein